MSTMRRITVLVLILASAITLACTRESRAAPLRLGTTTTVEQSGVLALLNSLEPRITLDVVVGPSGQILRSAAAGDLDVVLTHAPGLEQRLLIASGRAAWRCPFVASRFAVVGPGTDPAHVRSAPTAADAFRRIAASRSSFISRGDSSGTHLKELALWQAAGVAPPPGTRDIWYIQAGVDQAATLHLADERHAYALADLPTFTRLTGIELRVLFSADTALSNPYTLYVIRSARADSDATRFSAWALADWRARLLSLRLPGGEPAFAPLAGGCIVPDTAAVQ